MDSPNPSVLVDLSRAKLNEIPKTLQQIVIQRVQTRTDILPYYGTDDTNNEYSPENSDKETLEDTYNQKSKATNKIEETTTNAHHNDGQPYPESNSDASKQNTHSENVEETDLKWKASSMKSYYKTRE